MWWCLSGCWLPVWRDIDFGPDRCKVDACGVYVPSTCWYLLYHYMLFDSWFSQRKDCCQCQFLCENLNNYPINLWGTTTTMACWLIQPGIIFYDWQVWKGKEIKGDRYEFKFTNKLTLKIERKVWIKLSTGMVKHIWLMKSGQNTAQWQQPALPTNWIMWLPEGRHWESSYVHS